MRAWRWFQLDRDAALCSPCQEIPVEDRTTAADGCRAGKSHEAPAPGCGCGVYGIVDEPEALSALNYPFAPMDVLADVTLSGRILRDVSNRNWRRASSYTIETLTVVDRVAAWAGNLERRYGVPVYVFPAEASGPQAATDIYRPPESHLGGYGFGNPPVVPAVEPIPGGTRWEGDVESLRRHWWDDQGLSRSDLRQMVDWEAPAIPPWWVLSPPSRETVTPPPA